MEDVIFSWRKTVAKDLPECLGLNPTKNGHELVGRARAIEGWKKLLGLGDATRSAVVERQSTSGREIVGFGLAAFVKERFADAEVLEPRPGLNARVIESVVTDNSVVATLKEVRDANTRGTLQQVILDTSWKRTGLNRSHVNEVRVLLGQAYHDLFAGYRFSRIITELVDELDFWHLSGTRGEWIFDRFGAYRKANRETLWNADRALAYVTADSIRADPHSIAADLFLHRHPQFMFRSGEQQLLEVALDGLDDGPAAIALCLSVAAIKRRWTKIFERVAVSQPDLCDLQSVGVRGMQKRQRILAYMRNHPEELRPFK
jgi:hypothetical protein